MATVEEKMNDLERVLEGVSQEAALKLYSDQIAANLAKEAELPDGDPTKEALKKRREIMEKELPDDEEEQ
jgi:hypothetical protein